MRRKDRALALLLAIGMTLCLLSACGQGGPAPSQTSAADASTAELSAQPTEAAAEPEQETASLPESSAEAEGSGEVPLEPPEDAEASPLTGSTVKGIDYPIGDPDDPTEFSLFSVWGMGFDEFLDSWNSLPRLEDIQAATGCRIRFHEVSQTGASEQFNLMIASGDMDDIIQAADYYVGGLGAAYDDEVIIDLSDMIEENAPIYYDLLMNHSNQTTRDVVLTDGKHLSMNTLKDEAVSDMGLVVRGDWLDELGMEVPETLDEFTDVLYAIHDNYNTPQTIYVNNTGEIPYMDGIFGVSIFKVSGSTDVAPYVDNGTVKSGIVSDEYREFVAYVRQLIKDDVINKDFYVNASSDTDTWGRVSAGETGVWRIGADSMHKVAEYTENPDAYCLPIPKLVKEPGDKYLFGNQIALADNKGYSLTSNCEEPEMALQFFDWFFTDEGVLISNYGIEGETFEYVDGQPQFAEFITNNPNPDLHMMFAVILNTFNHAPMYNIVSKMWVGYTPEEEAAIHLWSDTSNDDTSRALPTAAALSTEETSLISNQMTAVISYASEEILKFMTSASDLSDENWRAFCENCSAQGLDEIMAVYQNAYEEYLSGDRQASSGGSAGGPPPDGGPPPEGPPPG